MNRTLCIYVDTANRCCKVTFHVTFQGSGFLGASSEILPGDRHSGHAERDKKRRAGVRRDRHDDNLLHMRPLRTHSGAHVPHTLSSHQDAEDELRRDRVRGLPLRAQVTQAVG